MHIQYQLMLFKVLFAAVFKDNAIRIVFVIPGTVFNLDGWDVEPSDLSFTENTEKAIVRGPVQVTASVLLRRALFKLGKAFSTASVIS